MATHRKSLPVDAYYVARIVAAKHEARGITASRAFPATKRVLGYAKSCSIVDWNV